MTGPKPRRLICAVAAFLALATGPARAAAEAADDAPSRAAEALAREIPAVEFRETRLSDAVAELGRLCDVRVELDGGSLSHTNRVLSDTPVTVTLPALPLERALQAVLLVSGGVDADFGVFPAGEVVIVGNPEHCGGLLDVVVRSYDVLDILEFDARTMRRPHREPTGLIATPDHVATTQPAGVVGSIESSADALIDLLARTVNAHSWRQNGGVVGAAEYFAGHLFVTQSPPAHHEIGRFLERLRADLGLPERHPPTTRP